MKRVKAYLLSILMVFMMIQPLPQASAAGSFKVQSYNMVKNEQSNTIGMVLNLVNTGSQTIDLSEVTVRYYYTNDGSQGNFFACDYSPIGSNHVVGNFHTINAADADRYLEVSFDKNAGNLAAGSSIPVHIRIWKADWSNFNQANDYSFLAEDNSLTDTTKISFFVSGNLVWGTEPGNTTLPTEKPTAIPTKKPTVTPTQKPTVTPTQKPTVTPTMKPTLVPTATPIVTPSISPLVPEINFQKRNIPNNNAMAFVQNMKIGWNLGNTMDANNCYWLTNELAYESSWCGAVTTKAMIDTLKASGFNAIRIPVSWHDHVSGSDFKISDVWMNRVQEIVNYGIDNDMYVILNTHHDVGEKYYYPTSKYLDSSKHYVECIWEQIATHFADYDEHLVFESLNEPRMVGHTNEWWIDPNNADCIDSIRCINELNQVFVDTVRAAGGKNEDRYLMCPGYDASPDGAVNDNYKLPTDIAGNTNKIIVSVHAYTPYSFALEYPGTDFWSVKDPTSVNNMVYFMDQLYEKYTSKGIPVVIGEFGCRNKEDNLQSRVEFASYYIAAAKARGISCFWWDNNAFTGEGELFGLLDRSTNTIKFPEIVEGMTYYAEKYRHPSLVGTGDPTPTTRPTVKPTATPTVAPTATPTPVEDDQSVIYENALLTGRFDVSSGNGAKFAWSNTSVKANFTGTGIKAHLASIGDNWLEVVVDGVSTKKINVKAGVNETIELASGLTNGTHTIELVRRTEASQGETTFFGFDVIGGELLAPPKASARKILFVGDSITCGYGNEGEGQWQSFTTKNENAYMTYAALTARALDADLMNISWSGKALYQNYDGSTTETMPKIFDRILPYNESLVWDHSQWTPDAVVINLGTNDMAMRIVDRAGFVKEYKDFINRIRSLYGDVTIYCAIGPMLYGDGLISVRDYTNTMVKELNTNGDQNVFVIEFPQQDGSLGMGEDWHPSLATHKVMAEQLTKQMKKDMNW